MDIEVHRRGDVRMPEDDDDDVLHRLLSQTIRHGIQADFLDVATSSHNRKLL